MAKYQDVNQISDDLYEATIIPQSLIEKFKLAYMVVFHSSRIRCNMLVDKNWFNTNITDKDIEDMNNVNKQG